MSLNHAAAYWPIFGLAMVFGAARAFYNPASTALAPALVPRELLPRAIAWNSLSWQGASIAGPAVGGLLCAISPAAAYVAVGLLYLVSILCLLPVTAKIAQTRQTASRVAMIKEGLVYVWRNKIVFGSISLDLAAVLLAGPRPCCPCSPATCCT